MALYNNKVNLLRIFLTLFAVLNCARAQNTTYVNVALGKNASQSSDIGGIYVGGGKAGLAVDGNTNGVWDLGSVSHSGSLIYDEDTNTTFNFWNVDLGGLHSIDEIKVYTRTDPCCDKRMTGYYIEIHNDANDVVWTSKGSFITSPSLIENNYTFSTPGLGVYGSSVWVKVDLVPGDPNSRSIELAEVEVMGLAVPAQQLPPGGGTGGDPHFRTFDNKMFSYHGQCDLLLMRSKLFDDEKGLTVYVRTTRVDNYSGASYSFISAAAVQIGRTVLEISSDDGRVLVDGSPYQQMFSNAARDNEDENASIIPFAGYMLKRSTKGAQGRIAVFDLNLENGKMITIRNNSKSKMLFIDVKGYFEDSEGLLGAPPGKGKGLLSRDKKLDMTGNWNSFGEEWQVLDTEPALFQEKRTPQYPQGCVYEATFKKNKHLRRRLLMDFPDDAVTFESDARKACAKSIGQMMQFCVDDVMATGDLELAADPFYHANTNDSNLDD